MMDKAQKKCYKPKRVRTKAVKKVVKNKPEVAQKTKLPKVHLKFRIKEKKFISGPTIPIDEVDELEEPVVAKKTTQKVVKPVVEEPLVNDSRSLSDYEKFLFLHDDKKSFKYLPTIEQYNDGINEDVCMYRYNKIMKDVEEHCENPNKNYKITLKQFKELDRLYFKQDPKEYTELLKSIFETAIIEEPKVVVEETVVVEQPKVVKPVVVKKPVVVEQPKVVIDQKIIDSYERYISTYGKLDFVKYVPTIEQYNDGIRGFNACEFNIMMCDVEIHCKNPNKNYKINF